MFTLWYTFLLVIYKDSPEFAQLSFQDAGSPVMEEIVFLHDEVMFVIPVIAVLVLWLMYRSLYSPLYYKYLTEGTTMEIVWTIIPAIMLVLIAFPSLKLLYLMDEALDPALTIKAVGHQWYWSYEYADYQSTALEFDSYMVPTGELQTGDFRLLEADQHLIVPIQTHVRLLVTGADVIHAFALPALGLKVDAIPGRLNQLNFLVKSPGMYYGQCSEICGANHSFMPIVLEAVSLDYYVQWVADRLAEED